MSEMLKYVRNVYKAFGQITTMLRKQKWRFMPSEI
jgi:hypothetical protein